LITFQIAARYYVSILEHLIICRKASTYISLDVLVLKVESMFPDIDTNDRGVGQERILVSGGRDFKDLGSRVYSLHVNET
jgi:hypothetical protein